MRRTFVFDVGAILAVALLGRVAPAQTNEGRILGTVVDQQGKVIVAAKMVIANVDTGVSRALETNQAGNYVAPNLFPGLIR